MLAALRSIFLGDTDCIRHVSAVFIDHLDRILRNRPSLHRAERSGNREDVCATSSRMSNRSMRLCAGFEFVCAVAGADCDCKAVNTGTLEQIPEPVRGWCKLASSAETLTSSSMPCKPSEFALNDNAVIVCIFNNLTGEFDVVLEGL